jgi:di/tricarboxylate transporter
MDGQALTGLALGVVVLGAAFPRVGLDILAVVALALLVVGGVLDAAEAAAGFGSTTLLTVACMFVLAEGLRESGAVQAVEALARR